MTSAPSARASNGRAGLPWMRDVDASAASAAPEPRGRTLRAHSQELALRARVCQTQSTAAAVFLSGYVIYVSTTIISCNYRRGQGIMISNSRASWQSTCPAFLKLSTLPVAPCIWHGMRSGSGPGQLVL